MPKAIPRLKTRQTKRFHSNVKEERKTAHQRGYSSRWRKARLAYLQDNPLCVFCKDKGIIRNATVVDHIIPHRGNKVMFWDRSNWQPLCKRCHDSTKQREEKRNDKGGGLKVHSFCTETAAPVNFLHPQN